MHRGRSSIGRALALQARGCRFDPGRLQWQRTDLIRFSKSRADRLTPSVDANNILARLLRPPKNAATKSDVDL